MHKNKDKKSFKIYGIYDTETCNIGVGNDTRAYPILFIFNDVHNIDIGDYVVDNGCDDIRFYRYSEDFLKEIYEAIEWGKANNIVPIICAYNLMFDLFSLMRILNIAYDMKVNAQTATSAYTVDIVDKDGNILLRFWDTFYLEMNGVKAMGETCGVPKAIGDWDYSLIRTQETVLSETELHYAARDVQVIPAYLAWLIASNSWLTSDMLGCNVITKTSLVRQFARFDIGKLTFKKNNKSGKMSLIKAFEETCIQEFPKNYHSYALRKACFRGGLTFTAANNANCVWRNVASLDVTSMHHTFINGRYIPVKFNDTNRDLLNHICKRIINTSIDDVLENYAMPFLNAIHAHVRFTNIRLKDNSIFKRDGIGIIPESKFTIKAANIDFDNNESNKISEEGIKSNGYRDYAEKPMFAFSKLMRASIAELYINELELWAIAQVYDFDNMEVLSGESTCKFIIPPDYVTLQSNILFEQKTAMKTILKHYVEGESYQCEIPSIIPSGIRDELVNGSADTVFLNAYYNSTIKGMFNGIYGTQAMDLMKPDFIVRNGEIIVDRSTVVNEDNYEIRMPSKPRVLYTYGMRIVGGSRMHLVIAMILLYKVLGNKAYICGGDTDSIKVSLDKSVTNDMLNKALWPLANASDIAIRNVMRRNRDNFVNLCSDLTDVGHFDIERAIDDDRWEYHFEAWNKARISMSNGIFHVTCAGLSRPRNVYHIESWCNSMFKGGYSFEQIARAIFGYDVFIDNSISHSLEHYRPKIGTVYHGNVKDYRGEISYVDAYECIALYPSGRWLGETTKRGPMENIKYLESTCGYTSIGDTIITCDDTYAYQYALNNVGDYVPIMKAVK